MTEATSPTISFGRVTRDAFGDREMSILVNGVEVGTMSAETAVTTGEWWCAGLCATSCADAAVPGLAYVVLEIDGMSTLASDAKQVARAVIEDGLARLADPASDDELARSARAQVERDRAVVVEADRMLAAQCEPGGALAMARFMAARARKNAAAAKASGLPSACRLLGEAKHWADVAFRVEVAA